MKPKSPSGNKSHNNRKVNDFFNSRKLDLFAIKSGYKRRSNGKISAKHLMLGFMIMASKKKNSYDCWSQEISLLSGRIISRQAVEERMRPETTALLKLALEEELKRNIQKRRLQKSSRKFNQIKLEDSTVINLPEELSSAFPGNVSNGKKKSQAKVHALYDFTENTFDFLNVHSFTQNDQFLSKDSIAYLNKGDLLLRDMGFLVLEALNQIQAKEAYFISLKRFNIQVYDSATKKRIDLVKNLSKGGFMDREVLISSKLIPMRLIMLPLPPNLVEERRRKARRDKDKRLNHSKEYYQLLGYSILITNIPQSECSAEEVSKLYGLRWQIEIVFKSWKSCFLLEGLIPTKCTNPHRIYCMIYLCLMFILIFHSFWIYHNQIYLGKDANLSMIKLARFFSDNFIQILTGVDNLKIRALMLRKCQYDKRNDRINLIQKFNKYAA
ncbi:IS4 family transposase [candidate division KSB1 bacterium]